MGYQHTAFRVEAATSVRASSGDNYNQISFTQYFDGGVDVTILVGDRAEPEAVAAAARKIENAARQVREEAERRALVLTA